MKAILLLAVFALAASAVRLNITAYQLGFVDQLHLNSNQTQDAVRCQNAVVRAVADVQKLSNATNPEAFAFAALDLYNDVKRQVLVECKLYVNDLVQLALTNANNTNDLKALVERNLQRYAPQIIQQVTIFIDAVVGGSDYQAGQTEAYILQILLGLETPTVVPVPEFNYSKYVPFSQSKLIWETYRIYFTKIGMKTQDVNVTLQCLDSIPTISQRLGAAVQNLSNLTTLEAKLVASKAVYGQFIDNALPCIKAIKAGWEFGAPQRNLFLRAPAFVVLTVLHNVGLNLPQIQESGYAQSLSLFEGNYTRAGEIMAQTYKTIYNGLF